jgi:pyruvate formate-lyase activating enzyme-like uncharacterized protein
MGDKEIDEDINKIRLAGLFFNKPDIGVELPLLPDKKKEILEFILKIKDYTGFVNLNELEISETNLDYITRRYKLEEGGYIVSGSRESGIWILHELNKRKTRLKVHLCTSELKDWHQYKNRLLLHKILPFGKKTEDGTVVYYAIYAKDNKEFNISGNEECSVYNLAQMIISKTGSKSKIKVFKEEKAQPQQVKLDISELQKLGYNPKVSLEEGVARTIEWYQNYLTK